MLFLANNTKLKSAKTQDMAQTYYFALRQEYFTPLNSDPGFTVS